MEVRWERLGQLTLPRRDAFIIVALILATLAFSTLLASNATLAARDGYPSWHEAYLGASALGLLAATRSPVLAASFGAMSAAMLTHAEIIWPLTIALVGVGVFLSALRGPRLWYPLAPVISAVSVASFVAPAGVPTLPWLLGTCMVAAALGLLVGQRHETRVALNRSQELEHLTVLQAAEHVRLRERQALARELHDIVGHHVTAIVVVAEAGSTDPTDSSRVSSALGSIVESGRAALSELDVLVNALHCSHDGTRALSHGRLDTLEGLIEPLQSVGIDSRLHVSVETTLLDSHQLTIYRVVQEAVTNILRHAEASRVRVSVSEVDGVVHTTIDDDGTGLPSDAALAGRGLAGIAVRATGQGGRSGVTQSSLGGTRVWMETPASAAGFDRTLTHETGSNA